MSRLTSSDAVVSEWHRRSGRALDAHYDAARVYDTRAQVLGIATRVSSFLAAIGTVMVVGFPDVFAIRLGAAITAGIAAGLALVTSELGPHTRSEKHRESGAGYSQVRRLLETCRQEGGTVSTDSVEFLRIRELYREVSRVAPVVPTRIWNRAVAASGLAENVPASRVAPTMSSDAQGSPDG